MNSSNVGKETNNDGLLIPIEWSKKISSATLEQVTPFVPWNFTIPQGQG